MVERPEPTPAPTCAQCDKPRPKGTRNKAIDSVGTRLAAEVWLFALDRDPFCSSSCARAWHRNPLKEEAHKRRATCLDCTKKLNPARNGRAGDRCRSCGQKFRRHRRFYIEGMCAGCGCELNDRTKGCYRCYDRHRSRERQKDPVYRAKQARLGRERKRRIAAEKKLAPGVAVFGGSIEPLETGSPHVGGGEVLQHESGEADAPAARRAA